MRALATALVIATMSGPAWAQSPGAAPPPTGTAPAVDRDAPANPAVRTPAAGTPDGPVPGANSFTEDQVRSRLTARGFAEISPLAKDRDGIWRGRAVKDGRSFEIAVDYQGNVIAR